MAGRGVLNAAPKAGSDLEDPEVKLLYRRPRRPHHPQILHGRARAHPAAAKKRPGDKRSTSRPPSSRRRPRPDHQLPPDRRIWGHHTPEASRLRQLRPRRGGEEAPATLFHPAAATTTLPAPVGNLHLLSTSLGHRSTTPPPSRRHKGSRRGRRPAIRPSAGQWISSPFLSPLRGTVRERGVRSGVSLPTVGPL